MLQQHKFPWFIRNIFVLHCQQLLHELDCKLYHNHISKGGSIDDTSDKLRTVKENAECHFQLYKSKGQHLLTSGWVLDSIVKSSNIKATDTVLEIGPGTGNLTLRLLQAASKVVAIEIDKRMAEALQKRVAECGLEDRLTLICEDAMKTEFPHFDLVVANIPYGISSPLIAKLLFGTRPFRSATLLLQKEFACRLLANPGDSEFNRLAVNVKLVAEVEHVMNVSKRDFFPVPKVDSSVVIIRPKVDIPQIDLNEWCAFTRTCFSKKNKTLGATFKQKKKLNELMRISCFISVNKETPMLHPSSESSDKYEDAESVEVLSDSTPSLETRVSLFKEKVIKILRTSGFEDKRPLKISIEELLHLLSLFNENKIYFHGNEKDVSNTALDTFFES
ncbi:ribosomal RNA small subunit methyltransferase, mitochondrial-like [Chenopodium quinoa]|uniref:rRNA adenine N(6)-methyltransferase n=1 Tax=Chenopodium quinoa TaxID=63459 RepID=A0A803L6Z2_CHEQI|nr:ribosomal RNA small subunit methyltransferase, mitochondrial-like [Chenopodium quinoa]XP_021718093.1 ribosomal RNA small subunit methyltransferase, mitochondrial-like [Chenopodium quinoa]